MMDNLVSTSNSNLLGDEEAHHGPKPENTANDKDDKHQFRIYDGSNLRVQEHYRDMRQYQTVEFYRRMEEKVRNKILLAIIISERDDSIVSHPHLSHFLLHRSVLLCRWTIPCAHDDGRSL